MNVIERAKDMILKPAETWPVIEAEPASVASIYKECLVILVAIPAVCKFIGLSSVCVDSCASEVVPYLLASSRNRTGPGRRFSLDTLTPPRSGER